MAYYILYPRNTNQKVKIVRRKPFSNIEYIRYGFAEGSFKTKSEVIKRLNWVGISANRRPNGYYLEANQGVE